jgi:hypothetical protein
MPPVLGEFLATMGNAVQPRPPRRIAAIVCAWCGDLREGDAWIAVADAAPAQRAVVADGAVSHTICPACVETVLPPKPLAA